MRVGIVPERGDRTIVSVMSTDPSTAALDERITQFEKMATDDPENDMAHFSLGRSARGEAALGVIAVDEAIPANVMEELAALPHMRWVRQVEFT